MYTQIKGLIDDEQTNDLFTQWKDTYVRYKLKTSALYNYLYFHMVVLK